MRRAARDDGLLPLAPWSLALADLRGLQHGPGNTEGGSMNKWDVALGALEDARLALNAIPIPRVGAAQRGEVQLAERAVDRATRRVWMATKHVTIGRALVAHVDELTDGRRRGVGPSSNGGGR